jgi:hypothetical protein
MASTQQPTSALSFAERTALTAQKENQWQSFNSKQQVKFYPDNLRRTLKEIGDQLFPGSEYNSNAYQEAILNALSSTISPEIGVIDFWGKLTDLECEYVEIDNGHLNFFNAEGARIDITPFTQQIVFEAHSSYYKQRQKERLAAIAEARLQLEQLKKEIFKKR